MDIKAIKARAADGKRNGNGYMAWVENTVLDALITEVERLQAELDAAKKDIRRIALTCKHGGDCDYISAVTGRPDCMGCTDWEWRGPVKGENQ